MRISDWSSDVCSSDLGTPGVVQTGVGQDGQPTGTIAGQPGDPLAVFRVNRSEEHTSELQSLMRISYAVFCLKKKKTTKPHTTSMIHSTAIQHVSLKTDDSHHYGLEYAN